MTETQVGEKSSKKDDKGMAKGFGKEIGQRHFLETKIK